MTTISDGMLSSLMPKRETGAHKWGVGGVLVIAGSPTFPGASWLTCRSAGRNGAGIVYLATSRNVIGTMASAMPEVAFVPIPDTDAPGSARRAKERLEEPLAKVRSVVIGPGLGDDASTDQLLSALFGLIEGGNRPITGFGFGGTAADAEIPDGSIFSMTESHVVLDADGLNWLAKQQNWWEKVPANRLVLTPHPGEANRLSGIDVADITADPGKIATELASKWHQTVVIKSGFAAGSNGSSTVIADLAPLSLATAGSGDCFAGTVGAYLAQGVAPIDAVTLAIGIGTRAAITLERDLGIGGVIATDLPDAMARIAAKLL